jgi:Holliday junction resolvase
MSGGRASRQKGSRNERALLRILQAAGIGAEKTPLSGALGGKWRGDLTAPVIGRDLVIECKARRDGFRELYGWLQDRDVLALRADRAETLIVIRLRDALPIVLAAERGKGVANG